MSLLEGFIFFTIKSDENEKISLIKQGIDSLTLFFYDAVKIGEPMKTDINSEINNILKNFKLPETLGFGNVFAPIMVQSDYADGKWSKLEIKKYGPLQLDPAAKVLHYAQEIFEGMKAYKNDDEEVYLFRPDMNAERFNSSATRMAMPNIPVDMFIEANKVITDLCRDFIPTEVGASLYLRPFMIATEPTLGVRPSKTYSFIVLACPSGNYFTRANVSVYIESEGARASEGGTGYAKTGGNYAASLKSFKKLEEVGCDQTLWLDAAEHKYIEELSGMNFFAVINGEFHTPAISDTILEGITRNSILQLAKDKGIKVIERKMNIDELIADIKSGNCTEAFACGTASILTPISELVDDSGRYEFKNPEGKLSIEVKLDLLMIQSGRLIKREDWQMKV